MVPESPLEQTEYGLAPTGKGWFVLNARDAPWYDRDGRGFLCEFEGFEEHEPDFSQFGINIQVLRPGEIMSMYHWEADQEDFLVVAGEGVLVVEGEERPLGPWDFVHCPPGTNHVIVGAGDRPCVVVAVGAREHQNGPGWGGYSVDETARRHGASVDEATSDEDAAYARFRPSRRTRYPHGLLPGG